MPWLPEEKFSEPVETGNREGGEDMGCGSSTDAAVICNGKSGGLFASRNVVASDISAGISSKKMSGLNANQQAIITATYLDVIFLQKPDFFHKTWIRAVKKSPRLNEVIAFGQFCVRDLTKWPKLNSMAVQQKKFVEKLVFVYKFDEVLCGAECRALGQRHCDMSQFGFQSFFFDLFNLALTEMLTTVKLAGDKDGQRSEELVAAYKNLMLFVTEKMVEGYCQQRRKKSSKVSSPGYSIENAGNVLV